MKRNFTFVLAMAFLCFGLNAQSGRQNTGDIIRCYTTEVDAMRRAADPSLGSLADFERWLAPKIQEYQADAAQERAVITIPIVFHVIHNNGADNLSATYINAQIDQLNQDFRKLGSGSNSHPAGADAEILFCAATIDPNGNTMAEPGIDRVNRSSAGFSTPPYSTNYYESTIKPNTIWDPTQYCNVWVSDLSGGLLGYAQFPEASSLPGIGTGNGGANTDGVVVIYYSVGSQATPHPQGGNYAGGRTLTHELGHWLGLRHIWGDGGCGVDDYCNDTPASDAANYGCPTTHVSCGSTDMVQNYMDYTNDYCMNIFTNDQKARMQTVMSSSVRRASLANSNKCGSGGGGDTEAPSTPSNLTASAITTTTATLSWNASNDNVGVTGYDVYLNGSLLGNVSGTSANITGMTPSTAYTAQVRAKDAAGNQSAATSTTFTTLSDGGSGCAGANLTLTINLDNYPEETKWNIKNSGGSTVAFGGTYGSSPDGSTITENITLASGNYTFTIEDSYGDGICCGYGNGSYSLTSGGLTLASGGQFGSSESTSFCVDTGPEPEPDTEAPSTPTGVTASNITQTSATISWNASSDNVGVTGYDVYVGGSLAGTTSSTSFNLSGLSASTNYNVSVTATDEAENISGAGTTSFTTLTGADTQAPSTPGNVTASNITETAATISWSASSDNVGVTGYSVYLDGSLAGTTAGTSLGLTGLSPATNYAVSVTASDAAGNTSGAGSTTFSTSGGGGTQVLFAHYFESGWDGWSDGGSDCYRYGGSRSYEGNRSIRIRDNSNSSNMTLYNVDVTGYDQLQLKFYFYSYSMENGEDFWVRINDGSGWQTVAVYARGTHFNNNAFYTATVTLNAGSYNFNSGFDFRFQNDASNNGDQIYIDEITLKGIVNGRMLTGTSQTIDFVRALEETDDASENALLDLEATELVLYPNPAKDFLQVATGVDAGMIQIYSVAGVLVSETRAVSEISTIDISALQAGTYFVRLQTDGKVLVDKFIKY